MSFEDDTTLRTAIRAYLIDVLEQDPDDVESYDDDELWGEVLDWINWLTVRLASQECKIERLESVLFEEEDDDDLDEELDELEDTLDEPTKDAEADYSYDDLECDGDE